MAPSRDGSEEGSSLLNGGGVGQQLRKALYTPNNPLEVLAPETTMFPSSARWKVFFSLLAVVAYLLLGVVTYTLLAGMSTLDALYFCVVTLTTVGYGDLSAHTTATKLFACFYIFVGVAMIGAFLATVIETLFEKQEELVLSFLKESSDEENNSVNLGTGSRGSSTSPKDNVESPALTVVTGMVMFTVLLLIGTVVFKVSGDMTYVDALYMTVVSSSTVGYGDFSPSNAGTRLFAIFYLPVSSLLLAKIISDYTEMRVNAKREARQKHTLMSTVTAQEYKNMDLDNDGRTSPLEFLCRTLVAQEKVKQKDIDEVLHRFKVLDIDESGFIEFNEISAERDTDGDGYISDREL